VTQVAAAIIFLATIATIVVRPPRIPEWLAAALGALLMIAVGVEPVRDAAIEIAQQWNVLLFFAGLTAVVAVAESAGFFAWVAYVASVAAHGSGRRLFFGVIAAGTVITLFLTNDAAAVVMTPLVFVLVRHLRLPATPYAFACTFIANGASIALPISNPINFIIGSAAGLRLGDYIAILWAPALTAAAVTIGLLWYVFRRAIRTNFDQTLVRRFDDDPRYRIEVTVLLGIAALALVATSAVGRSVGLTAAIAGAAMLAHGFCRRALVWRRVVADMNPAIVIMVAALFVAVDGVRHSGLLNPGAAVVLATARAHPWLAGPMAAVVSAAASNLFNNLPTALIAVGIVHVGALDAGVMRQFGAGAIVGCDLGPNLTTVGSLSTMIWLVLLRRRGLKISAAEYFKVGVVLAPAVLACSVLALWIANR
jgi:arsenical pump membrane protein